MGKDGRWIPPSQAAWMHKDGELASLTYVESEETDNLNNY